MKRFCLALTVIASLFASCSADTSTKKRLCKWVTGSQTHFVDQLDTLYHVGDTINYKGVYYTIIR